MWLNSKDVHGLLSRPGSTGPSVCGTIATPASCQGDDATARYPLHRPDLELLGRNVLELLGLTYFFFFFNKLGLFSSY